MHAGYKRHSRSWQAPWIAKPATSNRRWPTLLDRGALDSAWAPEHHFTSYIEPALFAAIASPTQLGNASHSPAP